MRWPPRRRRDQDLDDEIDGHLRMAARDRRERGETAAEARHAARREFGNVALVKEVAREMRGWAWLERVADDVRDGLRLMRKSPGFTAVAVLSLAIGIGALTTVFALINAVELKPLPVAAPEQLVYLKHPAFSFPIFRVVRDRGHMFDGVFAWELRALNVRWNDETEAVRSLLVTGEFYSTLGVRPVFGRPLGTEDDAIGSPRPVAVLSHAAWRRRYGGDPGAIGRSIAIEGLPFTIVGVAPPGFFGVAVGAAPEVTIPMAMLPVIRTEARDILSSRSTSWLHIMGRRRPGLDRARADAAFQVIWTQALEATTIPNQPASRRARYLAQTSALMPGTVGYSSVRSEFSEPLRLLLALVALLLLVACAAVANLLLARGCARQRELAVRIAIGASGGRLVRQLLIESLLLSLIGSVVGLILASWSARSMVGLLSTAAEPILLDVTLDWRVFGFTAIVTCLVAGLSTLAPALRALRLDPAETIKSGTLQVGVRPRNWVVAKLLVVSQVGFSLLLLGGAALLLRSLGTIFAENAGFNPAGLLVASVDSPRARASSSGTPQAAMAPLDRELFYRDLLAHLKAVPGVQSASLSWVPPISDDLGSWTQAVGIDGAAPEDVAHNAPEAVFFNAVSPGYFETVGTALVAGRDLTWTDTRAAPKVAIVNESLARSLFPGQTPIGRRITMGRNAARKDLAIVGVVRDAKYQRLQEATRRIAYLPYEQLPEFTAANSLVAEVRMAGAAGPIITAVRQAIRALDPSSPIAIETVGGRIRDSLVRERILALVATLLGVLALLLSCGALYGLMAHMVARRTNEIGIRLALGAPRRAVVRLVARDTLQVVVIGSILGLALAAASARVLQRFLYNVGALDASALAAATSLLLATALASGYLPARRAANVDPTIALRSE